MPRDMALITTWGGVVPGRETKSVDVFNEFQTFIGKHAADGKCAPPEPFFAADGSSGMMIVRGRSDALGEITESDEYERLLSKAQLTVQDVKVHWYLTGEDEIDRSIRNFVEVGAELGYM